MIAYHRVIIIMCGICGFTGKSEQRILKRMTDVISHRGPDEEGLYSDGEMNLGIRRLSIIDVETGHQPVHNEDQTVWAAFNGEIYNYLELRKELVGSGHRFYTDHSDTELIVHLYEDFGIDFAHKLNGMFAIALWDKKEKKLCLLRDRMGVKPLFYTVVDKILIFGSEIKAILSHPAYTPDLNYEGLYHYFTFKNVPAPFTSFKGIQSLLPGEILIFSDAKMLKKRWWKIHFSEKDESDQEYIQEHIFTLLEDATRLRMRSDVPFGAYLSGGVDSSTIVALMTRFSDKPIKTFSLGYEDDLKNKEADLHYARQVSQTFRTEHYEYIMSYKELIDEIENVIRAFDQPFSGTVSTYFLTKLIREHVKVALSGDAADELFGSYLSHRVAQPMYHFSRLYRKFKDGGLTGEEQELFRPCDINFLEDLYNKSQGIDSRWKYHLSLFKDPEKDRLLSVEFKSRLDQTNSFSLYQASFQDATSKDPLNRILETEWNTQLPDQVLAFIDFLSMAHSVEIRSPFLDYRLVEFVATIPGNLKIRNGNVKDILKKTVETLIPQDITNRPKEGFVLPIFDWMVEKLRAYCIDMLSKKRLKRHGLLDTIVVDDILNHFYSGDNQYAGKVWNLTMFQVWWEKYFG